MDLVESVYSISFRGEDGTPITVEFDEQLTGVKLAGFVFACVVTCDRDLEKARNTFRLYDQQGLVYDLSLLYDQVVSDNDVLKSVSLNNSDCVEDYEFTQGVNEFSSIESIPKNIRHNFC